MKGTLAEGEIAREGSRVLRKLAADEGATLAPTRGGYRVITAAKYARSSAQVASTVVLAFHHRGWLAPATKTGAFVLSDAGLFWLRRALAEEDPFAAQHQQRVKRTITDEQGSEHLVTINEGESPLGWLHRRRGADGKPLIERVQLEAGERLRRDFTLAQLTPRMAVDLSAPVIGEKRGIKAEAPLPETVLAAKQRFSRALKFVGPGLADLLIDVCCHLTGLAEAERAKGWPKRSGKVVVLQIALDRLAHYYGLKPVVGASQRGRIHAWHAPEEKKVEKKEA